MEMVGFLLPVVIDLINRKIEDSDVRFWVSAGVCAIVGAFVNLLETSWKFATPMEGFNSIAASVGVVFTMAQLSYKGLWSNDRVLGEFRTEIGMNAKEQ